MIANYVYFRIESFAVDEEITNQISYILLSSMKNKCLAWAIIYVASCMDCVIQRVLDSGVLPLCW